MTNEEREELVKKTLKIYTTTLSGCCNQHGQSLSEGMKKAKERTLTKVLDATEQNVFIVKVDVDSSMPAQQQVHLIRGTLDIKFHNVNVRIR